MTHIFVVAGLLGAGSVATLSAGCSSSSTSGGGNGADASTDSPTADANSPAPDGSVDTDSGDTDTDGAVTDAGTIGTEFKVDGQTCTFANLTVETKLGGGGIWRVTADLTCPVIGASSIIVVGEDNKTYPEVCALDSLDAAKEPYSVGLNVNSESDGGYNYESGHDSGACSITAGPTTAAENAAILLSATVSNGQGGTTHMIVASISARPM